MKALRRFLRWYRGEFPEPSKSVLTFEQLIHYWDKTLNDKWRAQLYVYAYRRSPWPDPQPSFVKSEPNSREDFARRFYYTPGPLPVHCACSAMNTEYLRELCGPGAYTISVRRRWKVDGSEVKQEICIANVGIG